MKTTTIPSLRVTPELRKAAEEALAEGETLSAFVEHSIRESIERRQAREQFLVRGLASRDKALQSGKYVSSSVVIGKLEKMLDKARIKADTKAGNKAKAKVG